MFAKFWKLEAASKPRALCASQAATGHLRHAPLAVHAAFATEHRPRHRFAFSLFSSPGKFVYRRNYGFSQ